MSEIAEYDTNLAAILATQEAAHAWGVTLQAELTTKLTQEQAGWTWEKHSFSYPHVLSGTLSRADGRKVYLDARWDETLNACEQLDLSLSWRRGFEPPPHPFHQLTITDPRPEIILFHLHHTLFPRTELEFRAQEKAYQEFLQRGQALADGIAQELGEGWVSGFDCDQYHDYGIELRSSNLLVHFDWAQAGQPPRERYAIYGNMKQSLRRHAHGFSKYPHITVTSQKTPRQIAGEIKRRVLPTLIAMVTQAELARVRNQGQQDELQQIRALLIEKSAGVLEFDGREAEQLVQNLRYWPRYLAQPGDRYQRLVSASERIDIKMSTPSTYSPAIAMELYLHPETAAAIVELLWSRGFFAPVTEPDPELLP